MIYKKALNWLYGLEGRGIKLGLSNIKRLLQFFDNPQKTYPIVLIAGTNGKGSVASFLAHILRESGLKVGIYTSPHLITLRERVAVLGKGGYEYISHSQFASLAEKLKKSIDKIFNIPPYSKPTYFEILTALSFMHFKEEKVDVAVCEVGLGGRLDATNVSEPILSVITNIGLEHTNYLGRTLSSVAREKGGIIKEETPLVTGAEGRALNTLLEIAEIKKAPVFIFGKDFSVKCSKEARLYQKIDIQGIKGSYPGALIALKGRWQYINASLAVASAEILSDNFPIHKKHIYQGLKNTHWPGRFEVIGKNPMFILDGAHNPQASKMLKVEVKKFTKGNKITMLFGVLKDKDKIKIMQELFPLADEIILFEPKTDRAVPSEVLEKEGKLYNKNIAISRNLSSTIKRLKKTKAEDDVILVCGSLYLVGEARSVLLKKKQD